MFLGRYQKIIGPRLGARHWRGQRNETAVAVAVLNRMGAPHTGLCISPTRPQNCERLCYKETKSTNIAIAGTALLFNYLLMEIIQNLKAGAPLNTLACLFVAFVLGSLIGLERQYRQRNAGLRTNALVAVGSAVFVDVANRLGGHDAAVHVMAYVVSGVGFLGAGTIMKEGADVRGLNTAATLWGSAAVGACAGASMLVEATLAMAFVLAANTLLRPAVNWINRKPIDNKSSEVTYTLCVIAGREVQQPVMAEVELLLEAHHYPVADLDVAPFGEEDVEINATLLTTSVSSGELEHIVAHLLATGKVRQAFWNLSTTE